MTHFAHLFGGLINERKESCITIFFPITLVRRWINYTSEVLLFISIILKNLLQMIFSLNISDLYNLLFYEINEQFFNCEVYV